ncbi:hypothetical protein [Erythrobacter sp. F6033]|uniref:hypothetical protein n=1 Tax=Erythrobacter sp. F6033 TaxID=2926401 RepID=UPI001FF26622|nr:hypothetical protein [Erythrobacter sp. F6033]MCK0128048.1 hypothetical protein [Erythrobacter sp. F6033]
MKKLVLILAASSVALGGCSKTHLSVAHDGALADNTRKPEGIPYRLPTTELKVVAQWTLKRCPQIVTKRKDEGGPPVFYDETGKELRIVGGKLVAVDKPIGKSPTPVEIDNASLPLEFGLVGSHTIRSIEGPSYTLNYEDLSKAFKTTQVAIEYHPNTAIIKSINASVQGQEPAAIGSGIKIAGSIAKLAFGIPPISADGTPNPGETAYLFDPCTPEAFELVKGRNSLVNEAKKIGKSATKAASEIALLEAKAALGALAESEKLELTTLIKKSKKDAAALKKITAALALLDKELTLTGTFELKEQSLTEKDLLIRPDKGKLDKFKKVILKEKALAKFETTAQNGETKPSQTAKDFEKLLTAKLKFGADSAAENICIGTEPSACEAELKAADTSDRSDAGKAEQGFVFRSPEQVRMTLTGERSTKPVIDANIRIAQLGRFRLLPLTNGFGENNSISATFALDGTPTKIEYKKTKDSGTELLKSGELALADILAVRDAATAANDAKKSELQLENDRLTLELDNLTKQRDIQTRQDELSGLSATTPSEIELRNERIAVLALDAQIAELEKRIRDALTLEEVEE